MPDEAEVSGLVALMLLHDSRRYTRAGEDGELITLDQQDRSRWDQDEIERALQLLERALADGRASGPGPYSLQAAIAACHATAPDADRTDWGQIAGLYQLLAAVAPSPVVELNRAVAIAMAGDLDAGLRLVDRLADAGELAGYYLLDATRADLLRRLGRHDEAADAYERALGLAGSEPERRYLRRRLDEVMRRTDDQVC